jgi:hypothetical protein
VQYGVVSRKCLLGWEAGLIKRVEREAKHILAIPREQVRAVAHKKTYIARGVVAHIIYS